jgi:DNA-binding response OmpR family regulator
MNRTVLVFSDRPDTKPAWMDAFQQRGLKAVATSSFAEAEAHWRSGAPMLTVVDIATGNLHSLDACRRLRTLAPAPILLVLAEPSGDDIMKAYQSGVTECIIRPASPAAILLKALAWSMRRVWMENIPVYEPPPAGLISTANL